VDLNAVIDQIRTHCPVFAGRVVGTAEFKPLPEGSNMFLPAAYVVRLDDQPGEKMAQNDVQQPITESFAVIVALDNSADERGQAPATTVDTIRGALFRALIGWQPSHDYRGFSYDGMALLTRDRSRLWYQFEFSTLWYIGPEDGWQDAYYQTLPTFDGLSHPDSANPGQSLPGMAVDVIDPIANPRPGPDGRIEFIVNPAVPP